MKLIKIFLKFKKISQYSNTENNSKFSKGDRVIILTRPHDKVMGKTAIVKSVKVKGDDELHIYHVEIENIPIHYLNVTEYNNIPRIFHESELDFYDEEMKRDYKLRQLGL